MTARVLRAVVAVGPLVAVLASAPEVAPWWVLVTVAGLAVGWALRPESVAGGGVILVVLGWWGVSVDEPLGPGLLVAAGALVAAHCGAGVASYGPSRMVPARGTVLLWVRRAALSFLLAPLAWLALRPITADDLPDGTWPTAVGALIAAAALAALGTRSGPEAP